MRQRMYDVLKGRFLIAEDAIKNWSLLLFLSFLALVMIGSSHSAERKVHQIAKMNDQVRALRTQFVDGRSELMRLKMESNIKNILSTKGIGPAGTPPQKIIVN